MHLDNGRDPRIYGTVATKAVGDEHGNVKELWSVDVIMSEENGKRVMKKVPGTEKMWPCDLVLLSMGFTSPENTLINAFSLATDSRNNIASGSTVSPSVSAYGTSVKGVFTAGDCRRGQSK